MEPRKIEIALTKSKLYLAEKILFKTTLSFDPNVQIATAIELMNEKLYKFLKENKIDFTGPNSVSINNNGYEYKYPSYTISLSYDEYLKLEKFRDINPEVSGIVESYVFSKESRENFLNFITDEAKHQAQVLAEVDHLTIKNEYKFEQLPVVERRRRVFPPLSARINHFQQLLEGSFKFYFNAE